MRAIGIATASLMFALVPALADGYEPPALFPPAFELSGLGRFGTIDVGGDANGDGLPDLLLPSSGVVEVFFGRAAGLPSGPDQVLVPLDPNDAEQYGFEGIWIGDVNADGFDDAAVSDYRDPRAVPGGRVDVHFGGPAGLSSVPDQVLRPVDGKAFGTRIAPAGDVNGDGFADLLVGQVYLTRLGPPGTHLFHGSPSGLIGPVLTIPSLGLVGGGVGDVNGDGVDDFVLIEDFGVVLFAPGSPDGIDESRFQTFSIAPVSEFSQVGHIGDVNGDGFDDVSILFDSDESRTGIFLGSATGLSEEESVIVHGQIPSARPVDFNGDAFADFVAVDDRHRAFLHLGSENGLFEIPSAGFDLPVGSLAHRIGGTADLTGSGVLHLFLRGLEDELFAVRTEQDFDVYGVNSPSGSEDGDTHVFVLGSRFDPDTEVLFGGQPATIITRQAQFLAVRTPPGTGTVDVEVRNSRGSVTIPGGHEYVAPLLAVRTGNVNVGCGPRADDILYSDPPERAGDRVVGMGRDELLRLFVRAPPSRENARYAVYGALGEPSADRMTPLGFDLGTMGLVPPLAGGAPQKIWNNIGSFPSLGVPDCPSEPASRFDFPRRILSARTPDQSFTISFQGIIRDDGSRSDAGFSVTNMIVVRVE